jgi:hypothetical protein
MNAAAPALTERQHDLWVRTVLAVAGTEPQRRAFISGYNGADCPPHASEAGRRSYRLGQDVVAELHDDRLAALSQPEGVEDVLRIALDQNDAMRHELAYIGNLISDLARAMCVGQANDDGSWPDLPGRINRLIEVALSSSAALGVLAQFATATLKDTDHG